MKRSTARKMSFCCALALAFLSCELADTTDEKEKEDASYSVVYDGNENTSGTVPVDTQTYVKGAEVIVKANTGDLAKTGYDWKGWNTKADGSGTTYAEGASFAMESANLRLFAK